MKNLQFIIFLLGFPLVFSRPTNGETTIMEEQKYFFEMDEKSREELLKKVQSIELNDAFEKVTSILGQPDYDENLIDKKGKFMARRIRYYLKRWEMKGVNESKDESVSFYFDIEGNLKDISSKIPGISKGKLAEIMEEREYFFNRE
ncbi:MAG: hypothetical protein NUV91_01710 [Candidatus Omnitrophica bacterium]|nr:hypothetical protein [Candidatus Omnitrophota bacterium]